jgi:nitroreductase
MIKGSEKRHAEYPVADIFVDRWSPRAMSGEELSCQELRTLFEAARWAPSSMNNQPWRILYAARDSKHWPLFFGLLADSNQVWCANAAVLLLIISKTTFETGKPCRTHSFDSGAAWMSLALQGSMMGLVVHGMQGFDYERAKSVLNIPDGYQVEAMAAIGRPGSADALPEAVQSRETPNGRRLQGETVCEGPFAW